MSDYLASLIRTIVPVGVGSLLGLAAEHGITIDADSRAALTAGLIALATATYYAAARGAEHSTRPWLAWLGRVLLGGIAVSPVYVESTPADLDRYGD
ncbi:hypothetical protein [Catellatospora sp. NPDC049609]|uniref:hypothetical protein n=1 Tax=Catellatospora sp. NPDC049609 TaxID=3155505 RepID=UPI00343324C9